MRNFSSWISLVTSVKRPARLDRALDDTPAHCVFDGPHEIVRLPICRRVILSQFESAEALHSIDMPALPLQFALLAGPTPGRSASEKAGEIHSWLFLHIYEVGVCAPY